MREDVEGCTERCRELVEVSAVQCSAVQCSARTAGQGRAGTHLMCQVVVYICAHSTHTYMRVRRRFSGLQGDMQGAPKPPK